MTVLPIEGEAMYITTKAGVLQLVLTLEPGWISEVQNRVFPKPYIPKPGGMDVSVHISAQGTTSVIRLDDKLKEGVDGDHGERLRYARHVYLEGMYETPAKKGKKASGHTLADTIDLCDTDSDDDGSDCEFGGKPLPLPPSRSLPLNTDAQGYLRGRPVERVTIPSEDFAKLDGLVVPTTRAPSRLVGPVNNVTKSPRQQLKASPGRGPDKPSSPATKPCDRRQPISAAPSVSLLKARLPQADVETSRPVSAPSPAPFGAATVGTISKAKQPDAEGASNAQISPRQTTRTAPYQVNSRSNAEQNSVRPMMERAKPPAAGPRSAIQVIPSNKAACGATSVRENPLTPSTLMGPPEAPLQPVPASPTPSISSQATSTSPVADRHGQASKPKSGPSLSAEKAQQPGQTPSGSSPVISSSTSASVPSGFVIRRPMLADTPPPPSPVFRSRKTLFRLNGRVAGSNAPAGFSPSHLLAKDGDRKSPHPTTSLAKKPTPEATGRSNPPQGHVSTSSTPTTSSENTQHSSSGRVAGKVVAPRDAVTTPRAASKTLGELSSSKRRSPSPSTPPPAKRANTSATKSNAAEKQALSWPEKFELLERKCRSPRRCESCEKVQLEGYYVARSLQAIEDRSTLFLDIYIPLMIENCPYLRHWMPRDRLQAAEWIGQFSREMGWSEPPQRFLARDLLHYLKERSCEAALAETGGSSVSAAKVANVQGSSSFKTSGNSASSSIVSSTSPSVQTTKVTAKTTGAAIDLLTSTSATSSSATSAPAPAPALPPDRSGTTGFRLDSNPDPISHPPT